MGIRTKNLSNTILRLVAAGSVTATANKAAAIVPFSGWITNINATFSTNTGGSDPIIDINKNGTTIFGASTKVTFGTSSQTAAYSALSSDPFPVSAGDIISMDADTVSTTLTNVCIDITVSKSPGSCGTTSDQNLVF